MLSPCVKLCVIDPRTQLCEGCKRSLKEIMHWTSYTSSERQAIMERLEKEKIHGK